MYIWKINRSKFWHVLRRSEHVIRVYIENIVWLPAHSFRTKRHQGTLLATLSPAIVQRSRDRWIFTRRPSPIALPRDGPDLCLLSDFSLCHRACLRFNTDVRLPGGPHRHNSLPSAPTCTSYWYYPAYFRKISTMYSLTMYVFVILQDFFQRNLSSSVEYRRIYILPVDSIIFDKYEFNFTIIKVLCEMELFLTAFSFLILDILIIHILNLYIK